MGIAITITPQEYALLRLATGSELPRGGQELTLEVRSGSGSASTWTYLFGPVFNELFGITFWPGSLNLWDSEPIDWERPFGVEHAGVTGEFCPVVLEERAVGLAFRAPPHTLEYLEVLSPAELRPRLGGLQDGQFIRVRLLSGELLGPAA